MLRRLLIVLLALSVVGGGAAGALLLTRDDGAETTAVRSAVLPVALPAGRVGVNGSLDDVAAGPGGFVAVGAEEVSDASRPVFLQSADGAAWRAGRVSGDRATAGDAAELVASNGRTWLALGSSSAGQVAWTSADGLAWARRALPEAVFRDDDSVSALASVGTGWAAVGTTSEGGGAARGVLWTSPDGTTWQRRSAADLRLPLVRKDEYFTAIAAKGATVVIAGGESDQQASRAKNSVAFWSSRDAGRSWSRASTPVDLGGRTGGRSYVQSLTTTQDGFLAGGAGGEFPNGDDYDGILLRSTDGVRWARDEVAEDVALRRRGQDFVEDVVQTGKDVVAVGRSDEGGLLAVGTSGSFLHEPTVTGGPLVDVGRHPLRGVAARGPAIVAVGSDSSSGDVRPAVYRRTGVDRFARVRLPQGTGLQAYARPFSVDGGQAVGETGSDIAWWEGLADGTARSVPLDAIGLGSGSGSQRLDDVAVRGDTAVVVGSTEQADATRGLVLVRHGSGAVREAQPFELWQDVAGPYADRHVVAVTAGSGGFTAVGYSDEGDAVTSARVWTSKDGDTWRSVSDRSFAGALDRSVSMADVAADGSALVAVGQTGTGADAPTAAAAWSGSADGRWTLHRLATPSGWRDAYASTVVHAEGRWIAFGGASRDGGDSEALSWSSADGTTWGAPVVIGSADDHGSVSGAVAVGTAVYAVGSTGDDGEDDAAGWVTEDGGASWRQVGTLTRDGDGAQSWSSVQRTERGLLLVGSYRGAGGGGTILQELDQP